MNRTFLIIALTLSLAANAKDYEQTIRLIKAETNPLLMQVAQKGVMHAYSAWARTCIEQGEYIRASEIYRMGVLDTFLHNDNRTVLAMELTALYNDHLLMHRSALQVLNSHHFSNTYPQAWIWTLRHAQTLIYLRQYDQALAAIDSIISTMPKPAGDLYATRGYIHMAMQHYSEAGNDLTRALTLTHDSTAYHRLLSNLAVTQAETNRCTQAMTALTRCITYARNTHNRIDEAVYLRKRANIALQCQDTAAAADDYTAYWKHEKQYILDNFCQMTQQQRLDYWANRKPLISGIFRLGDNYPELTADIALFRHQVAMLGVHDTTPNALRQQLQISAKEVQRCLKHNEAAVEIVKYYDRNEWLYAAVVLTAKQTKFVELYSEAQLHALPVGQHTLLDAVCSTSRQDKNNIYNSADIAGTVWLPMLDAISGKTTVWFAPDGLMNMLAIEYLPFPAPYKPDIRRLTSTALLTRRTTAHKQPTNALLVGGLDYNSIDTTDTTDATVNHNGWRQWQATLDCPVHFTYLPGSRREIDSITDLLPYYHKTYCAPEEQLKNELSRYNLVHLSTHGYSMHVSVTPPDNILCDTLTTDNSLLCCGFALSGANCAHRYPLRDDGLLTARELCELDLKGVEMMVASACQSAQGTVSDEGPAGMLRAMKLAGVHSVIATLWPVDDAATTLFMKLFYQAWHNGMGTDGKGCTKQQALRITQRQLRQYGSDTPRTIRKFNVARMRGEYIQKTGPLYDAPYYWAPFILVDDTEQ